MQVCIAKEAASLELRMRTMLTVALSVHLWSFMAAVMRLWHWAAAHLYTLPPPVSGAM
jgi:hypothetical protein